MRTVLNRHIPLDAIARWCYILVAGPTIALIFGLVPDLSLTHPIRKLGTIMEGFPPQPVIRQGLAVHTVWEDDLLFTAFGFLLASGPIWLLEGIGVDNQHEG